MATLEKIRSKGGILVALAVGLALFAFIMMDFMSSGASMFSGNQMEVANINGKSINIQEFQNKVSEMEEFNKLNQGASTLSEEEVYRLREQTWNQLINQNLLEEQYQILGLNVTSDELMDMVSGKNIHPAILQHPLFANPQTGAFDQQQVINFLLSKNQDPTAYFYWMVLEEQLMNERLFNKYASLIQNGMYIPQTWRNSEIKAKEHQANFDFVLASFTTIPDSAVSINEDEIKDYYNKHSNLFEQETSRDIEYVAFNIEPTEADRKATNDWVEEMIQDFSNAEIDPIHSFVANAQVGDVYGPYFEDNSYKATRLVAINNLPDSVKARHILIRSNTQEETNTLADSLLELAKKGADFGDLARRFSQDQGSAINGGDLGWFNEGMMVQAFNDAVFTGKTGDIVKVESQFGTHIIHIQDQGKPSPKYQVATLSREVTYSSKTYQDIYSKATKFAALNNTPEKFNNAIEEENLNKRIANSIGENDRNISGLESSRELVRWAYEANVGDLSPVYEFDDKFIFAHLIEANEKGIRPLEDVKAQIQRVLIANKKADILLEQMQEKVASGANLETIAQQVNSSVQSAENISFASFQIPGAGVEPALAAAAVNSPVNQISTPIKGNNGVYVIKVKSTEPLEVTPESVNNELKQGIAMKTDYLLLKSMRDNAEIIDKRANFY